MTDTPESLALLEQANEQKLNQLALGFEFYESLLSSQKPTFNKDEETALLQKAMDRLGMRLHPGVSGQLEDYIEREHIIEIYNQQNIQIYRNLEFFRFCSYTLLELALMDWETLYERPKRIDDLIKKRILDCMGGQVITPNSVPEHTLRERYLKIQRTYLINIKWGLPLVHAADPTNKAFISIILPKLVASGSDSSKITSI